MHLWPSMRIRDSFKIAYLKKLEWNLHRMSREKQRSQQSGSNQEKLLDDQENGIVDGRVAEETTSSKNSFLAKSALICREILLVLTCCYCCFCCGACVDQDEG
ncbi:hypothetical protein P3X46_025389 [Hevea brasiliensis]|uniref:Uncharacterized protein n=1 Tax=Hevea brasiliensis TaxID=3981 RepID=A0ABQ9L5E6_HEVBR|nr:uncharacterized protein LOC110647224 [Hevea brasiliensis]KAJ9159939.1 hypothetical protein P3X46_025389 [Hevea brasiliensis]